MSPQEIKEIWTSGGRKTARARIILRRGKGNIVINERSLEEYFPLPEQRIILFQPFSVLNLKEKDFDLSFKISGGGISGQLEAARHALARALERFNPQWRPALKKAGLLTRDARAKERKKYGLRKARRAPQFSKR